MIDTPPLVCGGTMVQQGVLRGALAFNGLLAGVNHVSPRPLLEELLPPDALGVLAVLDLHPAGAVVALHVTALKPCRKRCSELCCIAA